MMAYVQREKDRLWVYLIPDTNTTPAPPVNQALVTTQPLRVVAPQVPTPQAPLLSAVETQDNPPSPTPSSPTYSVTTPSSPTTPKPTPTPPTPEPTAETYDNPFFTSEEPTQLSPIIKLSPVVKLKSKIPPIVLNTVRTRSRMPEKPRNKFAGMTMKELDHILRGLYPEYMPEFLTTTGLVLDEAKEDLILMEELYNMSNPKHVTVKKWIAKLSSVIVRYIDNYVPDSSDEDEEGVEIENDVELDEF